MGLSFRKSVKLLPGVRMSLSRRGPSVSAGPRHAKVGVDSKGRRRGGFSLFGFSWRKRV